MSRAVMPKNVYCADVYLLLFNLYYQKKGAESLYKIVVFTATIIKMKALNHYP